MRKINIFFYFSPIPPHAYPDINHIVFIYNTILHFHSPGKSWYSTKYSLHYIDLPVQFLCSPTLPIGRPWIGAGLFDFGFSLTAGLTLKCGILIGGDFQQGLI
jgi:hypothetical protein